MSGSATSSCNSVGKGAGLGKFVKLSIDNQLENDFVAGGKLFSSFHASRLESLFSDGLMDTTYQTAYIGLGQSEAGWGWMNGDSSTYSNWGKIY